MKEKVLVTGAAGFIGSHVAEHCLALGMDVIATDNLSGGCIGNVPEGCEFIEGDPKSILVVEFFGDSSEEVKKKAETLAEDLKKKLENAKYYAPTVTK